MKQRTFEFALRIIRLVNALPRNPVGKIIGHQLIRCGTSVGANFRSAGRGKSFRDFTAKMKVAEEEADETCYWLDLIVQSDLMPERKVFAVRKEADELCAIITAICKTSHSKIKNHHS